MVKPAPNRFNPALLAHKPERMSVTFPLTRCKRLAALTADQSGELYGEIIVNRRGDHLAVSGHYRVEFQLVCQRCLNTYAYPVDANLDLTLVPDQSAADALHEDLDPLIIGEDGMLDVVDIFEDELILQIPAVPRHSDVQQCSFEVPVDLAAFAEPDTQDNTESDNSLQRGEDVFAELKKLRFKKS